MKGRGGRWRSGKEGEEEGRKYGKKVSREEKEGGEEGQK